MSLPNCPKCGSVYVYEDGNMLVCPECFYEWSENGEENSKENVVKDSNGNILQDGDSVTIIVKLKEQGYSQGKCSLTVAANGKKVAQNADIIYQPEYSTCAGFSVPVSSVGGGQWTISLSVTPLNGKPITKTLTKEI